MQLAVKKALYVNKEGILSKVSVKNDTRMSEWQASSAPLPPCPCPNPSPPESALLMARPISREGCDYYSTRCMARISRAGSATELG